MFKKVGLLCFFAGFCAAAFVDTLPKCSIKDQDCLKNLYPTIIKKISSTGNDEIGIPVLEPLEIKNVTISFLGALEVTLIKATVTGITGCTFDDFTVDLEKGSGIQKNTCSLTVEGQYNITPSVIINTILGEGGISGNGNTKVIIDDAHLSFEYPVYAQKRDDGEIYMKVDYENIKYDYEVKGGVQLFADNINLGGVETSKTIVPLFNENWRFLLRILGRPIIEAAVKIYFNIVGKFFDNVSTKYYISDDLTSVAKP